MVFFARFSLKLLPVALAAAALVALGPGRAAARPITYQGAFNCGDMGTIVSFVYDDQAHAVSQFQLTDACAARISAALFGADQAANVTQADAWKIKAVMAVGPDGSFAYSDEQGNHVGGVIEQKAWTAPCGNGMGSYMAHGFIGRPRGGLVQCGKGQFYMPCAKWGANPKP